MKVLTVLVIGGTGIFGRRIAALLAADGRFETLVGSRDLERARKTTRMIAGNAVPVALPRPTDEALGAEAIRTLGVDVVVDASGPFQTYPGSTRYTVARAAIRAGAHYLDLSDDADFVVGIKDVDDLAKSAGVYALSGASSFPVLTEAAVRHMAPAFAKIQTIEAGIAPSPKAKVGLNVIKAITGYAGQPTQVFQSGSWREWPALVSTRRRTIVPPGGEPLAPTTFSLFAVPDLQTLPATGLVTRDVWVGAGPRPAILHASLRLLARLVHAGVLPSVRPLARVIDKVCDVTRFGRDRGGMFVEVAGVDLSGASLRRSWDLVAEGVDGPMIPAMAVVAILRRHVEGRLPMPGARSAGGSLDLADYESLFAGRRIVHGTRELADLSLYRSLLGDAFDRLPAAVRRMHDGNVTKAVGVAAVRRGSSLLARLTCFVMGFPATGDDVAVDVTFERDGTREVWRRCFAGRRFRSVQTLGTGADSAHVIERFGPMSSALGCTATDEALTVVPTTTRFLGLRLPAVLAPTGHGIEREIDGMFGFDVEIAWLGRTIVTYVGTLRPAL